MCDCSYCSIYGLFKTDKVIEKTYFALALTLVSGFSMFICFQNAGVPDTPLIQGQLSFSDAVLKGLYKNIQSLKFYALAQMIDFAFMFGYGLLFTCLCMKACKLLRDSPKLNIIAVFMNHLAPLCTVMDVGENCFIMLTLTNPQSFSPWLAVAHSIFALFKWTIIMIVIAWLLFFLVFWLIFLRPADIPQEKKVFISFFMLRPF